MDNYDTINLFYFTLKLLKKYQGKYFCLNQSMINHAKINQLIDYGSNQYYIKSKNGSDYSSSNEIASSFLNLTCNNDITNSNINPNVCITSITNLHLFLNLYHYFILILDLPDNYSGGTKIFINSIINKYSQINNFLILRPADDKKCTFYKIYINNIYLFELSILEVIHIINLNKSKIKKIFINHLLNYSEYLINFILLLSIEKTIITHDHFTITNNNPQLTIDTLYDKLLDKSYNSNILNSVDYIITQNINNIYMLGHNSNLYAKLIISPLPDFRESDNIINTNNTTINILFIGCISKIKGSDFVNFFIKHIKSASNYKIAIFGDLAYNNDENICNKYKNIDEFNKLLIDYKPNLIIETSIWPETYSYTLTLSMLTQLPILYLKKPYDSVIEKRLENYKNAFHYDSLNDIELLIKEKKQDFFYTIKPIIYFNKFWETYFNFDEFDKIVNNWIKISLQEINKKIYKKNIILVTSKIYTTNEVDLTYASKRSIYTAAERFQQTVNTIQTIKKHIPNYFIVLIDNSIFDNNESKQLTNMVDYFINPCNDTGFLNYFTNSCKFKFLAELSQIIYSYHYFFKHIDFTTIKQFFKISGRYFINDNFNYHNFDNNKIIFKINENVKDRKYIYTSFYKLTNNFSPLFFKELHHIFINKYRYFVNQDLETIFYEFFFNYITFTDKLGITQLYSCWNLTDEI